jgi:hypothetical protein
MRCIPWWWVHRLHVIVLVWAVHHAAAVAQRAQWALWTARSAAQWAARAAEGATTAAAPVTVQQQ